MVLVLVVEVEVFWKPQNLFQRWRIENKGEEEPLETKAPISCNQIQMIPNVTVALDSKSKKMT